VADRDIAVPGERLVSGEAVELDVRFARVGSRVLALLIDILVEIVIAVGLVVLILIGLSAFAFTGLADAALLQGGLIVVLVIVFIGYPVLCESLLRGRTVGKLVLGLRVVRDDGGPIRFRHALTRSLVGVALEWPGLVMPLVTWGASLATMLANPVGKRLGDLAAGTIVIHERTPASWGWVPAMPPHLAGWAALLDLTQLDDQLALAVRHFLARNRQISEPARSQLGLELATQVTRQTTPPPPPGVPGWVYLAAVIAERHRRAARRLAVTRVAAAAVWPSLGTPTALTQPATPTTATPAASAATATAWGPATPAAPAPPPS